MAGRVKALAARGLAALGFFALADMYSRINIAYAEMHISEYTAKAQNAVQQVSFWGIFKIVMTPRYLTVRPGPACSWAFLCPTVDARMLARVDFDVLNAKSCDQLEW